MVRVRVCPRKGVPFVDVQEALGNFFEVAELESFTCHGGTVIVNPGRLLALFQKGQKIGEVRFFGERRIDPLGLEQRLRGRRALKGEFENRHGQVPLALSVLRSLQAEVGGQGRRAGRLVVVPPDVDPQVLALIWKYAVRGGAAALNRLLHERNSKGKVMEAQVHVLVDRLEVFEAMIRNLGGSTRAVPTRDHSCEFPQSFGPGRHPVTSMFKVEAVI